MANQFRLPDVGEGLTEAEITAWRVAVGDNVELNQTVVEVETAKAIVELPSPYAGTVLELLHNVGDTVPVGSPIITIGGPPVSTTPGDPTATGSPSLETAAATDHPAALEAAAGATETQRHARSHSVLVGYGVRSAPVARRPRRANAWPSQPVARPGGWPLASPPIRKFARSLAVDLATVIPTGTRGQVTRMDVVAAAQAVTNLGDKTERDIRTPVTGSRKRIAEAMVKSAFTAPHVTEWLSVDITRTLKLIERLRAASATRDLRITPLTILARVVLIVLARHPEINASWDASADEIVQHRDINLGIAVASPRGLIVPNIRAAQTFDFTGLAHAITDLITEARANRTTLKAMREGTFTITNVGVFGVDGATPILNPGESAILALGQTRRQPWNHKDRVRLRSVTTLALSFDHRLVDGELGSTVLAEIAELLEHPALALAR